MATVTTLPAPHRGAGPRYSPRRPSARPRGALRPVALVARTGNVSRYAVGPAALRRLRTMLTTLAVIGAALVALALAGSGDFHRECQDVMTGSDDMTSAATCVAEYGPRGY